MTEFVSGDGIGLMIDGNIALEDSHDRPCVLRSSLEWGDQCKEKIQLSRAIVWRGVGDGAEGGDDTLHILISPSG